MVRPILVRLIVLVAWALSAPASAAVVISELMYHPPADDEAEFVELHNTAASAVDLQDWCFDGVELCFAAGATIGPGQYRTLARNAAVFAATYGQAPDFTYLGELSNSGERVALMDAVGAVVDDVDYSGVPPWPVTPDGLGPSLEVIDPTEDNASPRNWRAATNGSGHTAGGPNSVDAAGLPPWISGVAHTGDAQIGASIEVSASVQDAASVELFYLIDFGSEASTAMLDNGSSGDGAAGDGVYGAAIPGQSAGTLVRYRIEATGPTGAGSFPRTDDTVTYSGTAVIDPDLTSNLPIYHWFIDPDDYADAIEHKDTDETEPAVFFYDGVVYDNVEVRVRGRKAREWPKNHWKFYLPHGHDLYDPNLMTNPVDNFNLQGHYSDKTYLREMLSWDTARDAGAPWNNTFHVRVEQNGGFYGLYSFLEDPDSDWLLRHGLDLNGSRYKAFDDLRNLGSVQALEDEYEKQSRFDEGYEDLLDLVFGINELDDEPRRNFLFDNLDLPTTINYLAVIVIVHDNDHLKKNYFVYRDTEGTERWTMHLWDKDLTFGRNFDGEVLNDQIWADVDEIPGRPEVAPSHPLFGDSNHKKYEYLWNRLIDKLHEQPEIRDMFFRRLRSLADELLAPGRYEARIDELVPLISAEAALDRIFWPQFGQSQTLAQAVGHLKNGYLAPRRVHLLTTHRVPGQLPEAQSASPTILINEIMYQPAGGPDPEFVELYNPSPTQAVDLSGWRLDGVALSFPPGTVILPEDHLVVVSDDVMFRSQVGPGKFVAAQYDARLDDQGERITLRDREGEIVNFVRYSPGAPWPAAAGGGGFSLELIDPLKPNDWVANWAASGVSGGTPDATNGVAGNVPPFPGLFINEVLPRNASVVTDEQGEFDPWIEIFNASGATVNMGGMFLTDSHASPAQWEIPAGTMLCGGCRLIVWADNEPTDGPLHATFVLNLFGGTVALYDASGTILDFLDYGALPQDTSFGRFPDGGPDQLVFTQATPGAPNVSTRVPLILNEYNAVAPDEFLDNGSSDPFWGTVPGNGGDWFELVVTEDRLDVRGWQLVVTDDAGGPGESVQNLVFSNDAVWSELRSGTLITVSEELPDDVSYDPAAGDRWINVRAAGAGSGLYISNQNFSVSNVNWQLTIKDAFDQVVFGPAGEGVNPTAGIGNDEVFKLEEDPSPFITPLADYNDGTSSTFGAPNVFAGGTITQNFAMLDCDGVGCSTADGECAIGFCNTGTGQCEGSPIAEGSACGAMDACVHGGICTQGVCAGEAVDCSPLDDVCMVGVCDSATGQCGAVPLGDGTVCDDGLACTFADICSAGTCSGFDGCGAGQVCQGNGVCAATTTTIYRNGTSYSGTHDATIRESSPGTNLGSAVSLEWDAETGSPTGEEVALIRFDDLVGADVGQIAQNSMVVAATLAMEVSDESTGLPGDVHEVLVDWNESSVTWNNFGGDPGVNPSEFGSFVAGAPVSTGTATIDVTASVGPWVADPAANRGWIFLPNATNGVDAWSSEYAVPAQRPSLTVEWLPPCTVGLECSDGLACNGLEVCDFGRCVFGTPPPPMEGAGVLLDQSGPTRLTWLDQGPEFFYDVAGGSLAALDADGEVSQATCLANGLADNSWDDERNDPSPGQGYYYLMRPTATCGPGTYGSSSSGSVREPVDDCGLP